MLTLTTIVANQHGASGTLIYCFGSDLLYAVAVQILATCIVQRSRSDSSTVVELFAMKKTLLFLGFVLRRCRFGHVGRARIAQRPARCCLSHASSWRDARACYVSAELGNLLRRFVGQVGYVFSQLGAAIHG